MADYEAEVNPNQPWGEDGDATVTPKSPFPDTSSRTLPLEHRDGGPVTVLRSEYPNGLVIIPDDSYPETTPATLPMKASSGDSIEIPNTPHQNWPDGIVALFTGY